MFYGALDFHGTSGHCSRSDLSSSEGARIAKDEAGPLDEPPAVERDWSSVGERFWTKALEKGGKGTNTDRDG